MSEYRGPAQPTFPHVASDPTNPIVGQTWFNTTEGVAKMLTSAGTIVIVRAGGGVPGIFPPMASDPASPVVGQCWYNTTTGKARIKTGAGIVDFTTGTGGGGLQFDAGVSQKGVNTSSLSANLTHSANADIVIAVWPYSTPLAPTSVTVGGAAATERTSKATAGAVGIYTISRASAGTETVAVQWSGTANTPGFYAGSYVGSTTHAWESAGNEIVQTTSPVTDSFSLGTANRMLICFPIKYRSDNATPESITMDTSLTARGDMTNSQSSPANSWDWKAGDVMDAAGLAISKNHTFTTTTGRYGASGHIALKP